MKESINTIFQYRGFIWASVRRDFQTRYQSSLLGIAWLVIQPLAMILVYTLIFSKVMQAKIPGNDSGFAYSIYLCSGLLAWGLFAEQLNRTKNTFIENANLMKKVTFPKFCLPLIVAISAVMNFFIIYSLFVVFLILSGHFPGINFLAVFPVLLIQLLFTLGLGVALGVLNVFFRDVGQLVDVALQFLFWGTPIVYTLAIIPEWAHFYIYLNPMVHFIEVYQNIMLTQTLPTLKDIVQLCALASASLLIGLYLFKKHSGDMVDEL
ncbi:MULTISPECIES: ABC transporter permease [Marinomonas]|uniref:Transport permease protein n=1 Tax=Marinomonas rhodophyticola TaxID=2992803 RepID=A0ABT3KLJ8_9GAMM|nr:ABC transporter permease [Marinomonas sp. KJ51-3]MCW4631021.1 ABC transporter permease [Marinomonas sp. KJ51-3]